MRRWRKRDADREISPLSFKIHATGRTKNFIYILIGPWTTSPIQSPTRLSRAGNSKIADFRKRRAVARLAAFYVCFRRLKTPTKIDRVIDTVHAARYYADTQQQVCGRCHGRADSISMETRQDINGKTVSADARVHSWSQPPLADSSLRPQLINSLASRLDKCLPAILIESVHGGKPWTGKVTPLRPLILRSLDRRSGIDKHAGSISTRWPKPNARWKRNTVCDTAHCSISAYEHVRFMDARSLHNMNFAYWSICSRRASSSKHALGIAIRV